MKSILYKNQPNKVSLEEVNVPKVLETEALIKVNCVGICGADIELITGSRKVNKSVIPGHEIMGTVAERGDKSNNLIGQRVAVEPTISCGVCQMCKLGFSHVCYNLKVLGVHVNGGMAEYVKVPINKLHPVPDEVSDLRGAVSEPVAVAVHVLRRSGLEIGDNVLIIGAGPIGLLIAQVCRIAGARRIVISEINPYRIKICKEMGFEVIDTDHEIKTVKRGFDICFEVSGTESGMKQIIDNVRARGKIIIVGFFKEEFPIKFSDILFRELEIRGSRVYDSSDFVIAIDLIYKKEVDVDSLVTNTIPLKDFIKGIKIASKKEAMKVIVKVN